MTKQPINLNILDLTAIDPYSNITALRNILVFKLITIQPAPIINVVHVFKTNE